MDERILKRVKLKGRVNSIVRELYLRDDISCKSTLCQSCMTENESSKICQLDKGATHYVIPCLDVLEKYLEVFELEEMKGIIILQSILLKVMQSCGHRFYNRLHSICKDIRRGNIVFLNEICKLSHVPRSPTESLEEWIIKCCAKTAEYYAEHLNGSIPIILVSENVEIYKSLVKHCCILVYSLKEYLEIMCKGIISALHLYESLSLALSFGSIKDLSKSYDNYLPLDILEAGIKAGRFIKGHLHVNKHNASQEAFVAASKTFVKDTGDIFICGMIDRNRAIHGDLVVVELLPENEWKSRCLHLVDNPDDIKGISSDIDTPLTVVQPTGKVVGVLERCWRNYVATLPEEEEDCNSSSRKGERILVIPYDYRIPKIRIVTKQTDNIRNQRIIVRIDNWDQDSQYPNGHFVQTLGEIGNLEAEVQSLLVEHSLFVGEFSRNLISELPVCTNENLWKIDETEILKRRDLRNSHLIFSIDPEGCEDVDDALSVRELPSGMLELGVHIADVTYFVQPLSAVDFEARNRSTSVYLPDRRYDMLPPVLSGNLCSLLGNADRYAVSVLWELDSKCSVQNVWYGRTVIKSKYKLSYETAQDILCNSTAEDVIADIPELQRLDQSELNSKFDELKNSICNLFCIANTLRKDRLNAGGIELNNTNIKFEVGKMLPSVVSDVRIAKELAIHKTVAECMIFANHWVAKKISYAFPHQAMLRRHPRPRESDLIELQKLAETKGFSLNIQSNKELAISLENAVDVHDPSVNQILRIIATQSMNQAVYFCTGSLDASDFYHYGLGLDKYTHFTSPIRRYADILVHRLLLSAVGETNCNFKFEQMEIEEICNHMNMKHRAAQELEKVSQQLFLSFYLEEVSTKENSVPCIVDGIIYSVLTNGMLVFVPKYGIKGPVHLCNKDKKVAVVNGDLQWHNGKLEVKESCLIVKTKEIVQKYSIFDHITLHLKMQKSRYHLPRIIFELKRNAPYPSDLTEILDNAKEPPTMELTGGKNTLKEIGNKSVASNDFEEFNLYLFLEKIKALSVSNQK